MNLNSIPAAISLNQLPNQTRPRQGVHSELPDWRYILSDIEEIRRNEAAGSLPMQFSNHMNNLMADHLRRSHLIMRGLDITCLKSVYAHCIYGLGRMTLFRRKNACYQNGANPLVEYNHIIYHDFDVADQVPFYNTSHPTWHVVQIPNRAGIYSIAEREGCDVAIQFHDRRTVQHLRRARVLRLQGIERSLGLVHKKAKGYAPISFRLAYHIEKQQLRISFDAEKRNLHGVLQYE